MILGVGLDLIEVERIEESLARHGSRFIDRIAHGPEKGLAPAETKAQARYWAGRFAVKEAFAKALGTGIGDTVRFSSVGAARGAHGKPEIVMDEGLSAELKRRGIDKVHVSLTHSLRDAAAVVILEGESVLNLGNAP